MFWSVVKALDSVSERCEPDLEELGTPFLYCPCNFPFCAFLSSLCLFCCFTLYPGKYSQRSTWKSVYAERILEEHISLAVTCLLFTILELVNTLFSKT